VWDQSEMRRWSDKLRWWRSCARSSWCDRLASLQQLVGSYPEGHDTRVLLENLDLDRALRAVEENRAALREALIYPRGT
jgi:hypothetical protein